MTDPVIFSLNEGNGEPDRLGGYDDFAATETRPADFAPGLVSLGFITAAVRRSARFMFVMAIVGLLLGFGAFKRFPHQHQASAFVLLTLSPYENNPSTLADNQAIAKTSAVAGLALHELGLQESVSSFLSTYSVNSLTDRVLTITASAPSGSQADLRANAVASAFLKFRADNQNAQQNLVLESLDQQINQANQHVNSINAQINQLSSQPASPAQQSQIGRLRAEQASATDALTNLQVALTDDQTTTEPAMTAALKNSQILSVTSLPYSQRKPLVTYSAVGLILGLAVGLSIVVLRALLSDRLRRRDDIAYVLDAPVKLSVGTLRARRWRPMWPGRAARRDLDMRRVLTHLHGAVPRSSQRPAGLAIVAVDNASVVAQAVAELATSYASQRAQVVTADLSSGAHLGRLLRAKKPGTSVVSRNGTNFMMAVPNHDDPAPVGPLPRVTLPTGSAQTGDALVASDISADLLLTLVTLDPALGGDHLATWATNAVVVVSAGQSSVERINGVGEMIRLAGVRLDSVVLIGADKRDKSLGLMPRREEQVDIGVLGR